MNSKERCLAAIKGELVDRVPVFPLLMFLSVDRLGITYRQFATDGAAMAEAQLNIYRRFPIDAITACSDPFRIVADCGGEMAYPEMGVPHAIKPLVTCDADIDRLPKPDASRRGSRMADRTLAVRQMSKAVGNECLVVGMVDLPFAEACSFCGVSEFMVMIAEEPKLAHRLLEFLTPAVIEFSLMQMEAGSPLIGVADAAASLVSAKMFREFALPYEQRVIEAIQAKGGLAKLHICGNTNHLLPDMARCGADVFNVDHMVDLARALEVYGAAGKCIKGNVNPVADMMQATAEECRVKALKCMEITRGGRYILGAGCEVPAGVSDEVFRTFCETPQLKNHPPHSLL
jgi:MtaA/CmuA family methyltransferase